MAFEYLIFLVLAPMAAGLAFGAAVMKGLFGPIVIAVLSSAAIALIYLLHEGVPPIPPVTSKQKLGLALLLSPAVLFCCARLGPRGQSLVLTLFASACFLWLIQRPLMAGRWTLQWLLPILTILLFSTVPNLPSMRSTSRFAWPLTLLAMTATACALASLGGYLGLGQVMISLSVFLGGHVLALLLPPQHSPAQIHTSQQVLNALTFGLGLMLVQLSTFATNLSVAGYLLLLTMIALPFADRKFARLPTLMQPLAYGAAGLLIAIPAVLMALSNF